MPPKPKGRWFSHMNMSNTYDEFSDEYVAMVSSRDEDEPWQALDRALFKTIGDVEGLCVLDAGCGEGYVSRVLEKRGADVTAVDVSQNLVDRGRKVGGQIDYLVADMSLGLPGLEDHFDLVASHFVLNDVPNYIGFINTIGSVTKAGGRAVLSFNNPYSAVTRQKAESYFDSGTAVIYQGMSTIGVNVYHYHRTMSEYMKAFSDAGFLLRTLAEPEPGPEEPDDRRDRWLKVPFQIVTEFVKTGRVGR